MSSGLRVDYISSVTVRNALGLEGFGGRRQTDAGGPCHRLRVHG